MHNQFGMVPSLKGYQIPTHDGPIHGIPVDALIHQIAIFTQNGIYEGYFLSNIGGKLYPIKVSWGDDHQFEFILSLTNLDFHPKKSFAKVMSMGGLSRGSAAEAFIYSRLGRMITYNVRTEVEGARNPAIYAGEFLRWGHKFMSKYYRHEIDALMANWILLPGATNMQQYIAALREGMTRIQAAHSSWTAKQFARMGYPHIKAIMEYPSTVNHVGKIEPPGVVAHFVSEAVAKPIVVTDKWSLKYT